MSKYTTAANRPKRHGVTMLEHLEQRRLLSASGFQAETMAEVRDLIKAGTHSPLEALAFVRSGLAASRADTTLPPGVTTGVTDQSDPFTVYSAMRHVPADVSTQSSGLGDIYVTYSDLFGRDANGNLDRDMVDEDRVRRAARIAADSGRKWVVNIEDWAININEADPATVQETMDKFLQLIEWAKDERPEVEIGIYGIFPIRDYWTPVHYSQRTSQLADAIDNDRGDYWIGVFEGLVAQEQAKYDAWEAANQFLQPLADAVDFIAPSLYTFYDNPTSWQVYAEHNLQQAAAYGKPVFPFLMPTLHNTSDTVNGDDFRAQLDFVSDRADSVVIWRGFSSWDSGEGWWQATEQFVTDTQASADRTPVPITNAGPVLPAAKESLFDEQQPTKPDFETRTGQSRGETTSVSRDTTYQVEASGRVSERVVPVSVLEGEDEEIAVARRA
ncbi:MAG: hypothetical protein AAF561_09305 [Planctomycetota bacterium]